MPVAFNSLPFRTSAAWIGPVLLLNRYPDTAPGLPIAFHPAAGRTSVTSKGEPWLVAMRSRGHWLVGGRALERAINETQRFLVRALGRDLLLLYPEEWKSEEGGED